MDIHRLRGALDKLGLKCESMTDKQVLYIIDNSFIGAHARLRIAKEDFWRALLKEIKKAVRPHRKY